MERYMFTQDDFQVDWGEVWRTTREVTPEEWDGLRSDLKQAYKHLRERIAAVENWNEDRPLGGVIALIAHSAYHLGEIRQATCVLKHK
jgi:Leu/Phe-tRNA-protein transferase